MSSRTDQRDDVAVWVQDALSAEHFVRKTGEHLIANEGVTSDTEASLLFRLVYELADAHASDLEDLLSELDKEPSGIGRAVGSGLGATLGWLERLPTRTLVQIVRDLYVALNYTAAGYHVLYTRAVLLGRPAAAGLGLRHLREYTPVIRRLSQMLAWASALDLAPEHKHPKGTMNEIVETLLDSWSSEIASSPWS